MEQTHGNTVGLNEFVFQNSNKRTVLNGNVFYVLITLKPTFEEATEQLAVINPTVAKQSGTLLCWHRVLIKNKNCPCSRTSS